LFAEAETFNPDRFLESVDKETATRRDPKNYVFGFGRRICPGRALVHSSIWVFIVSMIATSNITKAVDENGNPIEPEVIFDNAIFRLDFIWFP
jgi:cytochrome P450